MGIHGRLDDLVILTSCLAHDLRLSRVVAVMEIEEEQPFSNSHLRVAKESEPSLEAFIGDLPQPPGYRTLCSFEQPHELLKR
jgi:hypothetical protein